MLKLDILFELLPKTSFIERYTLKGVIDDLDKFLDQEWIKYQSTDIEESEDEFYDRFYTELNEHVEILMEISQTHYFMVLIEYLDESFVKSAGYWPNVYLGDNKSERHAHSGNEVSIMTLKNMINLLQSIYSIHFGGYNGIPHLYENGEENTRFHNFSEN